MKPHAGAGHAGAGSRAAPEASPAERPAPGRPRGRRGLHAALVALMLAASAGVLIAFYLSVEPPDARRAPAGVDTPWYVWRSELVSAGGLGALSGSVAPGVAGGGALSASTFALGPGWPELPARGTRNVLPKLQRDLPRFAPLAAAVVGGARPLGTIRPRTIGIALGSAAALLVAGTAGSRIGADLPAGRPWLMAAVVALGWSPAIVRRVGRARRRPPAEARDEGSLETS